VHHSNRVAFSAITFPQNQKLNIFKRFLSASVGSFPREKGIHAFFFRTRKLSLSSQPSSTHFKHDIVRSKTVKELISKTYTLSTNAKNIRQYETSSYTSILECNTRALARIPSHSSARLVGWIRLIPKRACFLEEARRPDISGYSSS
jgi:hypothetical protein